jgi:hypothetical protein
VFVLKLSYPTVSAACTLVEYLRVKSYPCEVLIVVSKKDLNVFKSRVCILKLFYPFVVNLSVNHLHPSLMFEDKSGVITRGALNEVLAWI